MSLSGQAAESQNLGGAAGGRWGQDSIQCVTSALLSALLSALPSALPQCVTSISI